MEFGQYINSQIIQKGENQGQEEEDVGKEVNESFKDINKVKQLYQKQRENTNGDNQLKQGEEYENKCAGRQDRRTNLSLKKKEDQESEIVQKSELRLILKSTADKKNPKTERYSTFNENDLEEENQTNIHKSVQLIVSQQEQQVVSKPNTSNSLLLLMKERDYIQRSLYPLQQISSSQTGQNEEHEVCPLRFSFQNYLPTTPQSSFVLTDQAVPIKMDNNYKNFIEKTREESQAQQRDELDNKEMVQLESTEFQKKEKGIADKVLFFNELDIKENKRIIQENVRSEKEIESTNQPVYESKQNDLQVNVKKEEAQQLGNNKSLFFSGKDKVSDRSGEYCMNKEKNPSSKRTVSDKRKVNQNSPQSRVRTKINLSEEGGGMTNNSLNMNVSIKQQEQQSSEKLSNFDNLSNFLSPVTPSSGCRSKEISLRRKSNGESREISAAKEQSFGRYKRLTLSRQNQQQPSGCMDQSGGSSSTSKHNKTAQEKYYKTSSYKLFSKNNSMNNIFNMSSGGGDREVGGVSLIQLTNTILNNQTSPMNMIGSGSPTQSKFSNRTEKLIRKLMTSKGLNAVDLKSVIKLHQQAQLVFTLPHFEEQLAVSNKLQESPTKTVQNVDLPTSPDEMETAYPHSLHVSSTPHQLKTTKKKLSELTPAKYVTSPNLMIIHPLQRHGSPLMKLRPTSPKTNPISAKKQWTHHTAKMGSPKQIQPNSLWQEDDIWQQRVKQMQLKLIKETTGQQTSHDAQSKNISGTLLNSPSQVSPENNNIQSANKRKQYTPPPLNLALLALTSKNVDQTDRLLSSGRLLNKESKLTGTKKTTQNQKKNMLITSVTPRGNMTSPKNKNILSLDQWIQPHTEIPSHTQIKPHTEIHPHTENYYTSTPFKRFEKLATSHFLKNNDHHHLSDNHSTSLGILSTDQIAVNQSSI